MSVREMVKVRRRTNIVGRQSRISCRVGYRFPYRHSDRWTCTKII